jgi:dolichol-phosphate mannosyltransferase
LEGTVIREYKAAIDDNIDIIVKIDSGSQMKPSLINKFSHSLINYFYYNTMGNHFYDISHLRNLYSICKTQIIKLKVVLIRSKFY